MTSTDHAELFDRAMRLRDEGSFEEAIKTLQRLIPILALPDEALLKAHSLVQVAYCYKQCERHRERLHSLQQAVIVAPKFELASLSLFHVMFEQGRRKDAFDEMIRFASLKDSPGYRELLNENFISALPPAEQLRARRALTLLQRWK